MIDFIELYPKGSKILLVGTLPPPMGGVSTHVYRAFKLLSKSKFEVAVFDTSKRYLISYFKLLYLFIRIFLGKYTIIHIHTTRKNILRTVLLAKKFKNFKLFFTDHNPRLFINSQPSDTHFYSSFFTKLSLLIAVGDEVFSNYKKHHIKLPENHIILNAFLPPEMDDEESILANYDAGIKSFIQKSSPILVANAYKLILIDGIDLYGLDLCIHLTHRLKSKFPEIGFLFALPNPSENRDYLKKCEALIVELRLEKNFMIIKQSLELWPLFRKADLMVRPTFSDGYGISIDEALFLGCPAVASDVCSRHPDAITFKNRDLDDFYNKCHSILMKLFTL